MNPIKEFIQSIDDHEQIMGIINRCPEDMDSYVDDTDPNNTDIHGYYVNAFSLRNKTHAECICLPWYEKPRYNVQKLSRAVSGNPLKVGDKVKFDDEKRWLWKVCAVREEFAILTKDQFGKGYYTIIDYIEGIRGPDDHYGVGYETDEQIENAMKGLFGECNLDGMDRNIEISHRHRIPLVIADIKPPSIEAGIARIIEKYGVDGLKEIIDGVPAQAKYFVDAFSEGLQKQGFCTDKFAASVYGSHKFYPLAKVRDAIGLG